LFAVIGFSLLVTDTGSAVFGAVDACLHPEANDSQIPGLKAVIVSGDQEVVYTQDFGTADASGRLVTPHTPMVLGWVSKRIAALGVIQMVEAGKLDILYTLA
jgi:CubicO group peptidase (beta-lactamase class C family)